MFNVFYNKLIINIVLIGLNNKQYFRKELSKSILKIIEKRYTSNTYNLYICNRNGQDFKDI